MLPPDPRINALTAKQKTQLLVLMERDPQEAQEFVERVSGMLLPHTDRGDLE
jgi:uncharacterized protein YnzC (UPF0291/DUF896 family)